MTDPTTPTEERWLGPGVAGIGTASLLADVGHEIPTALLPSLLTATLGAPASALGLIEGIADGLAGAARLAGGALADDPRRRRTLAVGGYTTTAVLSSLIGAATTVWQVGVLRAGAWAARGLRVPARNALLADIVPATVYGRAYAGFAAGATSVLALAPWFVAAGIAIGCVETAEHAAVAALASAELRGSAFGLLAAVQSFGNLAASAIAGLLWTLASPRVAFGYLVAWMLLALVGLLPAARGQASAP
jgi:hypothetical protein